MRLRRCVLDPVRRPRAIAVLILVIGVAAPVWSQTARRRKTPGPRSGTLPLMEPGVPGAPGGDTVRLPFNLVWGDTPERLARSFAGIGAQVTERHVADKKETWTVTGLLRAGPALKDVLLTFVDGALVVLEFRYEQADWDVVKYNDAMGFLRRQLEYELGGPGELISRKTEPVPAPDGTQIQQTLTGYEWKKPDTIVQLFYFAAEDPTKALSYRTISIHYQYQEPPDAPPGMAGQPPGPPGQDPLPVPDTPLPSNLPPPKGLDPLPIPDATPSSPAKEPQPSPAATASPADRAPLQGLDLAPVPDGASPVRAKNPEPSQSPTGPSPSPSPGSAPVATPSPGSAPVATPPTATPGK